ncbi:MAG: glutamine-hydrolyzing GMP synthase [Pseudomonadota bacterium]
MSSQQHSQHKILILDFGSQYTQLIGRRIREAGVYCEIHPCHYSDDAIRAFGANGIILSGSPQSAYDGEAPGIAAAVFETGVPVLGICYGMQVMAHQLGGQVVSGRKHEFGATDIQLVSHSLWKAWSGDTHLVWMSHGDQVNQLPEGFEVIARSDNTPIVAMAHQSKPWYGIQFHPEVTHTVDGALLLNHFVHEICGCPKEWHATSIIQQIQTKIQETLGPDDHVLLGLSGGVDSSVVAALLHPLLGERLHCVFVDTGMLRYKEAEEVMACFNKLGIAIDLVSASEQFLGALAGESNPEQKRKIAGRVFVEVFTERAKQYPHVRWLAQGTIYPDVIESGGVNGQAKVIKTHHNVGGLPKDLPFQLLEPLRALFKDEVRQIGLALGLPRDLMYRHPFPGPGLCVRILGEVKPEYVDILQRVDAIFIETLRAFDWYDKVSQAFAVFLPVRSVGVTGDDRRYEYVIALRAVQTTDFMTAQAARLPYELLEAASGRIINEVRQVARVTYDICSKPPATIEWE